jgi:serine phosphatase RsbU (regulator of sigma subunit)
VSSAEQTPPVRHVLLVEDDPGDAFLVTELLAEVDPELTVTVTGSLPTGAEQLAKCDCVLLDLNLPGTRGLDGLRALLRVDDTAAICVLTGLDDEHLGTAAVAAGAQDYLVKGKVDGQLLIRSIRYAVERRRAEASLLRLREGELAAAESARLERGLLPSLLLAGSAVIGRTLYRSGRARSLLGGDFFDAVLAEDGTVHAIIGDVCGHGPDEAALGALLRVSWRALVLAGLDELQVLPKLQEVLISERHDPMLFTTVCTVAVRDGVALVRLAGHPPPVALRPTPHALAPPVGLPLGVRSGAAWEALHVDLGADWSLLLYTDGLVEGRGPVPGELLWPEGLLGLLEQEHDTDTATLPGRLVEHAVRFNGGPLTDDVAILVLSSAGPA